MNSFFISFDSSRFDSTKQKHFEILLKNHKLLSGWSSPFPGLYLVSSSSENAEDISDSIEDFFDKRGLLVGRLYRGSNNRNGRMPSPIWEFLKALD